MQLVVEATGPSGVRAPAAATHLADLQAAARRIDHVAAVRVDSMSADGTVALATVQLDDTIEKVPVRDHRGADRSGRAGPTSPVSV